MSGSWIDAGDANQDVDITVPTDSQVDGTDVGSVRLVVSGAVDGMGDPHELAVDIVSATATKVVVRHRTTVDSFPIAGLYLWQATLYDGDGAFLMRSKETQFAQQVGPNQVPNPEGDLPDGELPPVPYVAVLSFAGRRGEVVPLQADYDAFYLTAAEGAAAYDAIGAAAAAAAASQPLDSDLTAIALLTTTAYGRALLELANAAAGRTALALGTAAVEDASAFDVVGSASIVRDFLLAHEALEEAHGISAYGATLVDDADAATARGTLGLGTAAVETATTAPTANTVVKRGAAGEIGTAATPLLLGADGAIPGTNPGGGIEAQVGTAVAGVTNALMVKSGTVQRLRIDATTTTPRLRAGTGPYGSGSSGAADFNIEASTLVLAPLSGLIVSTQSITLNANFAEFGGQITSDPDIIAFVAAMSVNLGLGNHHHFAALTGNMTSLTFTNVRAGATHYLYFTQDGTGGRTVTPHANFKANTVDALTIDGTANQVTLWEIYFRTTTSWDLKNKKVFTS